MTDETISTRMLKDIAASERNLRSQAEERARGFISLLNRLAYKVDGVMLEEARRKDPLAPTAWGPEEWEAHFNRALAPHTQARWTPPAEPEMERLREQLEELQQENDRLRGDLEKTQAPAPAAGSGKPAAVSSPTPQPNPAAGNVSWPAKWPRCPDRFRASLSAADITEERMQRTQMALWLMATQGLSTYMEIGNLLARQWGLKSGGSGSVYRLFKAMERANLVKVQVIQVASNAQRNRLMLVKMEKTGRDLAGAFDWKMVESEWERLVRLHQADTQMEHAGAILSLAYNARLHGYAVELIPEVPGSAAPDAKLMRAGEVEYVEVEMGTDKHGKWKNLVDLQGHVALCAGSVEARMTLAAEVRLAKLPGKATDIESLVRIAGEPDASIWMEEW